MLGCQISYCAGPRLVYQSHRKQIVSASSRTVSLFLRSFAVHSQKHKIGASTSRSNGSSAAPLVLARSPSYRSSGIGLNMSLRRPKSSKSTNGEANRHTSSTNGEASYKHESEHDRDHVDAHSHTHSIFGSHSHGEEGHGHGHEQIIDALQGSGKHCIYLLLYWFSGTNFARAGDRGSRITLIGLFANVGLTAAKGAAGWYMHSASLLADAGHSLSGMSAFVSSW